jgi:SAM-dependent methyltransferase
MADLDRVAVEQFAQQVQGSLVGAATVLMARLGDRLGLYQALAEQGPATPADLASRAGCAERYVREWLCQQAAVGFLTHDPETGQFSLPAAHAVALATDESPVAFGGAFEAAAGWYLDLDRVADAFRSGEGIAWGDHPDLVHRGTARFFGGAYRAMLADEWVPALGLDDVLGHGARVADVGCGYGVSTVAMATAYPESTFVGFDGHGPSLAAARARARAAAVDDRVRFEQTDAAEFDGGPYDVIWFFDCLHDLGDPIAAASRARDRLAEGGMVALVEPLAMDDAARNIAQNPAAGLHYAASTFLCVPHSLSERGAAALGGQAGGRAIAEVLRSGGFTHVEQVATTPVHAVYAARP